jgi:two-component system, OmpR family, heavy metal sensor histidine kinase CusS
LFRLKIALLSVLMSGLILTVFSFYSLTIMDRIGLERIDREILSLGEGHLAFGPPREYWQNFERSLRLIYPEERADKLVVQIKDPQNATLFTSPDWPSEITEDAFPEFDRTLERRAPPSGSIRSPEARPEPPPQAYAACNGKNAGNPSEFINGRGETVRGICEEENGRMVLRQTVPRHDLEVQPDDRPEQAAPSLTEQRADKPTPRIKKPHFAIIATRSGVWRAGIMGSERITMMVGANMAEYYSEMSRYRKALLSAIPIALLLLAAGGWFISQRALRPVALVTRTAEKITARALDQRIPPVQSDKEISRLVDVINGMLDRIERSYGQAVRFSADAAHELQTPLAIIQGELDNAVQQAPVGSEEQQRAGGLLEEVQRLKSIIQKLLILARADTGRLDLRMESTNLSELIEAAAEDAGAMAGHLKIEKAIAPGVCVKADPDLIKQAIGNLVSNAVKYNISEGGFIRFRLSVVQDNAAFSISNSGTPIPAEARDKIFDRFYRVDRSRSRAAGGSGLGLSLAREIVDAHHGRLQLDAAADNLVSFTMVLPCI